MKMSLAGVKNFDTCAFEDKNRMAPTTSTHVFSMEVLAAGVDNLNTCVFCGNAANGFDASTHVVWAQMQITCI